MNEETKTTERPAAQENQKPDAPTKEPPAKETKPESKSAAQDAPQSAQNAPESPAADEVTNLRAQLARANAERVAAIEAAKLGIDPKQVPYVLRLAELGGSDKPEDIAAAIQKVLDDVPAFKASASGTAPGIRIGAKDPQENAQSDALSQIFGNRTAKRTAKTGL